FHYLHHSALHTLSLHDALPICPMSSSTAPSLRPGPKIYLRKKIARLPAKLAKRELNSSSAASSGTAIIRIDRRCRGNFSCVMKRSEEHTSELQSRFDLVCRLLL